MDDNIREISTGWGVSAPAFIVSNGVRAYVFRAEKLTDVKATLSEAAGPQLICLTA